MRLAWFNPFAGIAGDMALGALVDAGAELDAVEAACRRLGLDGWRMQAERVDRSGLTATHVRIEIDEQHHHRRAGDIIERIRAAGLERRATDRAVATFALLAVAEGRLHGVAPADVQFHEVGAVDSILDIVGTAVALDLLGIDQVTSGPVAVGVGTINAAHGVLPNPAPAVLRVLEGAPIRGVDVGMELTTPTGAALLAALAEQFGPAPDMTVTASGYGAGTRNPPGRPNVVQVVLGERLTAAPAATNAGGSSTETVCLLETNLDDVTAETIGYVMNQALEAGALDVWTTPATMKKSRPGLVLSVLSPEPLGDRLRELVASETGSLGIRRSSVSRWVAARRTVSVEVDGHPIRVKVGPHRAKAEHDDVAAAAARLGRPIREIAAAAELLAGR